MEQIGEKTHLGWFICKSMGLRHDLLLSERTECFCWERYHRESSNKNLNIHDFPFERENWRGVVVALNWFGRRCDEIFGELSEDDKVRLPKCPWQRVRGRSCSPEVWCDFTVSKIAITFNYLPGCTNQNGRPEGQSVTHTPPPPLLVWTPPADFPVIITGRALLCEGDQSLCLCVTAVIKPHHISFWWLSGAKEIMVRFITVCLSYDSQCICIPGHRFPAVALRLQLY